jgi:hypothetical protein
MNRLTRSIDGRIVWALALLLGGLLSAPAWADSRSMIGGSPTDYSSPLSATDEVQAFQDLQRLHDNGRISDEDYHHRFMLLAAHDKHGIVLEGANSQPADVIELPSTPAAPGVPNPKVLPHPAAQTSTLPLAPAPVPQPTFHAKSTPRPNPEPIARPCDGHMTFVQQHDVASF